MSSQFRLIDYICKQLATRVFGNIAGRQAAETGLTFTTRQESKGGNKSGLWATGNPHITASES